MPTFNMLMYLCYVEVDCLQLMIQMCIYPSSTEILMQEQYESCSLLQSCSSNHVFFKNLPSNNKYFCWVFLSFQPDSAQIRKSRLIKFLLFIPNLCIIVELYFLGHCCYGNSRSIYCPFLICHASSLCLAKTHGDVELQTLPPVESVDEAKQEQEKKQ